MAAETDLKACAPPPRHFRWWLAMSVLLVAAAPSQAMEDIWSRLPRGLPADSLGSALRQLLIVFVTPSGVSVPADDYN